MGLLDTINAIGSLVSIGAGVVKSVMSSADTRACKASLTSTTNTIAQLMSQM